MLKIALEVVVAERPPCTTGDRHGTMVIRAAQIERDVDHGVEKKTDEFVA